MRAYSAFISPVLPWHPLRIATIACGARIGRTLIGFDRAHRKFRFDGSSCMVHESRTQNFQNDTLALSIAGPQDGRWPVAAVDGSDLRLEVVLTLTGGTTSIAEIVPHTAQTHRLRGSMLASCQHPRP